MITNIKIKNFKILKNIDLKLNNLSVISGVNSMGKSSFIHILLLLKQSFNKKSDGLLLNGDFINIGNGKDALSIDADENEGFNIELEDDYNETFNFSFKYKSNSNLQPITSNTVKKKFSLPEILTSSGFQYLSAERVGPKSSYKVSDFDINTLGSLGKNGEYTAHFIAEKGLSKIKINALLHEKAKSDSLLAQVDAWMSEITPGIKITANIIPEINQASLQYEFEMDTGYTEKFRPENVGFGLSYVLPVVTAVLASKPGDLIIIENPEAHLHPAGQSAIAALLSLAAQNGVQIFVETHSDHFLNGIRVATKKKHIDAENISIFYFSKSLNKSEHSVDILEPFIDKNGNLDEWPKGFFDEWDINLDKLLE